MVWAIGIAAAQPVGLREMFGSMTKSFHPGRAAQNGLMAALLASRNFTERTTGLEAKSGWANVLSTEQKYDEITGDLGTQVRDRCSTPTSRSPAASSFTRPSTPASSCVTSTGSPPEQIDRIDLRVHPLVLELTGKKTPTDRPRDGKFSVYFAAAVAIVRGAAGVANSATRTAQDPVIVALRDRVTATVDPSITQDQVRAVITLKDGRRLEKYVEHAVGSVERPMSMRISKRSSSATLAACCRRIALAR